MQVAICDATREGMALWMKVLESIQNQYHIEMEIRQYTSAAQFLFHLEDKISRPDLLLMDILLQGNNGITIAQKIREKQFHMEIVFLTNEPNHWPDAFDVEARHYLLKKEVSEEKIKQVLMKAVQKIDGGAENCFSFDCAGETRTVPVWQVRYFSMDRHIVTVYYGSMDEKSEFSFYTPNSFEKIENQIFSHGFVRIHRSYIVNLQYLQALSSHDGATLNGGIVLPIGRTYYAKAKEIFGKYQTRYAKV